MSTFEATSLIFAFLGLLVNAGLFLVAVIALFLDLKEK